MSFPFAAVRASSITLVGPFKDGLQKAAAEVKGRHASVKILYETIDITDLDQVAAALDRIVALVGELSILVCNVGDMPQLADTLFKSVSRFASFSAIAADLPPSSITDGVARCAESFRMR